jgi:hypothetical protein
VLGRERVKVSKFISALLSLVMVLGGSVTAFWVSDNAPWYVVEAMVISGAIAVIRYTRITK